MDKAKIALAVSELDELIRAEVRSGIQLWQTVPHLALRADGRSGYSDQYAVAYRHGIWRVSSRMHHGDYCVGIDLSSGELIRLFDYFERGEVVPALISDTLELAQRLDEIDASEIVGAIADRLRSDVRKREPADRDRRSQWLRENRSQYSVPVRFTPEHRQAALKRRRRDHNERPFILLHR